MAAIHTFKAVDTIWRLKLLENRTNSDKVKAVSPLDEGGWVPSLFDGKTKGDPAEGQTTVSGANTSPKAKYFHTNARRIIAIRDENIESYIEPRPGFEKRDLDGRDPAEGQTTLLKKSSPKNDGRTILHNNIFIVSPFTSPYKAIKLQCRPNELTYTTTGTWAAVSSMGRNNPFRMYTGGEDSITLDICWYCNDKNNRGEVINKCRLLESWTKADGYIASPPVLQLIWGSSGLYKNDFWILESASYKLTHFQDRGLRDNELLDFKLYPNYATQTLVFKKVTSSNSTWNSIVSIEELKRTQGISLIYTQEA